MNTEQLRAEFEALESKRKGFSPDTLTRASIEPDDEYLLPLVQARWEGYQAGRAALKSQSNHDTKLFCDPKTDEEKSAFLSAADEIERQEPVFMWHRGAEDDESEVVDVDCACPCCVPLYAHPQPVPDVSALVEALEELVDLMQGVIDGDYEPDCLTLQPATIALAPYRKGGEA